MYIQLNGIIISPTNLYNGSKIANFLTDQKGIIKVFVKGTMSSRSQNLSVSQLLCYSRLVLYSGKSGYSINEAEVNESFSGLRNDINKLSLAQYFCEAMYFMAPKEEQAVDYLRLLLNSLSYLETGKREERLIKPIFEMRLCTLAGYMPDLSSCCKCNTYRPSDMYFSIENSVLICSRCLKYKDESNYIHLKSGVSEALRHVVYSKMDKLFSFKISDKCCEDFFDISEKYILINSYTKFKALDFYKSLSR